MKVPLPDEDGLSRKVFLGGVWAGLLSLGVSACENVIQPPPEAPQPEDGTDQLIAILQGRFKEQLNGTEPLTFGVNIKPELSCDKMPDMGSLAVLDDPNDAIWVTCAAPLQATGELGWELPEGSRILALAKIDQQDPVQSSIELLVPDPALSQDDSARYYRVDPETKKVQGWFAVDTSASSYTYAIGDAGNEAGREMVRQELKLEVVPDGMQITLAPTVRDAIATDLTPVVASKENNASELIILSAAEYNLFSEFQWNTIESLPKEGAEGEIFRTVFDGEGQPIAVAIPGGDQAYTVTGGFVFTETQSWKWLADQNKFTGVELAAEIKQMLESGGQLVTSKEGWPTIVNSDGYARAVLRAGNESDGQWKMDIKLGLLFEETGNYQWIPETKEWKPIPKGSIVMDQEHDLGNLVELIPENLNDYRDKFFEYLVLINPEYFNALQIVDGVSLKAYLSDHDWTLLPEAGEGFLKLPRTWIGPQYMELSKAPLDKPVRLDIMPVLLAEAEEYYLGKINYKEKPLFDPNYLATPYMNTDIDYASVRLGICPIDINDSVMLGFELATNPEGGNNFGFPERDGSEVKFTDADVKKLNKYLKYLLSYLRAMRVVEGQDNLVVPGPKGNGGEQIYMGTGTADDWGVIKLFAITNVVEHWAKKGGLENTPFAPLDILQMRQDG